MTLPTVKLCERRVTQHSLNTQPCHIMGHSTSTFINTPHQLPDRLPYCRFPLWEKLAELQPSCFRVRVDVFRRAERSHRRPGNINKRRGQSHKSSCNHNKSRNLSCSGLIGCSVVVSLVTATHRVAPLVMAAGDVKSSSKRMAGGVRSSHATPRPPR